MKKELKELIEQLKLSDDQIMQLILSQSTPESESTDTDEESVASADSKEQKHAEKPTASEPAKPELKMTDLAKLISAAMVEALKADREATLMPAQKPLKAPPKPKPSQEIDLGLRIGEFNLV